MEGNVDATASPLPTEQQPDRDRTRARAPLTEREAEVLEMIGRGFRNAGIAGDLGISIRTVETHVQHILVKLAGQPRTQAALEAMRRGPPYLG